MIYFDNEKDNTLYTIVESIYLEEKFSDRLSNSTILICPKSIKYVIGKIIIINNTEYPKDFILKLLENDCKIISRVSIDLPNTNIEFQPYLIRPDFNIMWNGMCIDVSENNITEITDKLENNIIFHIEDGKHKLYFPKLIGLSKNLIYDNNSNLTAIGWLMHQIGINTSEDSKFKDLDLFKIKKLLV